MPRVRLIFSASTSFDAVMAFFAGSTVSFRMEPGPQLSLDTKELANMLPECLPVTRSRHISSQPSTCFPSVAFVSVRLWRGEPGRRTDEPVQALLA